MNPSLTQAELKELFDYRDGCLYPKKIRSNRVVKDKNSGSVNKNGYLRVCVNYKKYYVHQLVFLYHHGYIPKMIDHKDNNRLNNNISNLREVDKGKNSANSLIRNDNSCGVKGIYFCKKIKKYTGSIYFNKKRYYLGSFENLDIAEEFADLARIMIHGEYANNGKGAVNGTNY